MDLAVDSSILIAELSRARGRNLMFDGRLVLAISENVWSEVRHELPRRLDARVRRQQLSTEGARLLHAECLQLVARRIAIYPESFYTPVRVEARRRVPRDARDWPTVALALTLGCGIWTADTDFLGCGVPTWTTETLLLHL